MSNNEIAASSNGTALPKNHLVGNTTEYQLFIPAFDIFADLRKEKMEFVAEVLDVAMSRKVFSDQCAIDGIENVMIEQWVKEGASPVFKILRKVSSGN